jgi:hypothetical protein
VGEKNHTSNARTRRKRRRRSRIILPIPGVFPAIAECGRSKKGALEDEEGKQSTEIARLARRDGKGRAKKTQARLLPTICYIPSYLPTRPTCLSSYLVQFLEFFRPVLGGNRVTYIFFFISLFYFIIIIIILNPGCLIRH